MKDLPDNWEWKRLPEIIGEDGVFSDGDWVESKDQDPDGDVRLIQLADIGDGRFRNRSARYLTSKKAIELGCTFLEPGDVLVARMPDPLGRSCVFPGVGQLAVTAVDVCILRPPDGINNRWLMNFVNAPQFRSQINALQSGTTRKRISRKNLAGIPMPIPSRQEQQRIVEAIEEQFSRLDVGIESLQRAKRNLNRLRAGAVQSIVDVSWPMSPLGEVSEVSGGIQKQPKRRPRANAFPYLRVANVLRGELDLTEIHEMELFPGELDRYRLEPGDLLIVEGNGSSSQIGRSARWDGTIANCVHQNHIIRARPGDAIDPMFLDIYWNSPQLARRLARFAASTSGLYTLSTSKVKAVPIPVPSLVEQARVVAEIERQFSIIDALGMSMSASIQRARSLRQSILSQAFRGRLVGNP